MHRILYVVNSVNFYFVLMVLMLANGLETNDIVSECKWCVNVVILLFSLVLLSVFWPSFENVRWLNGKNGVFFYCDLHAFILRLVISRVLIP